MIVTEYDNLNEQEILENAHNIELFGTAIVDEVQKQVNIPIEELIDVIVSKVEFEGMEGQLSPEQIEQISHGETAYQWGNHSEQNYATTDDVNAARYGLITDVMFNSSTSTFTFNKAGGLPSVVVDLNLESFISNVALVDNDLHFTFEGGSSTIIPVNALAVGVVKKVNGKSPNAQGEVNLLITDIPNLSDAVTKANTAHGWGNHASVGYLTTIPFAEEGTTGGMKLGHVNSNPSIETIAVELDSNKRGYIVLQPLRINKSLQLMAHQNRLMNQTATAITFANFTHMKTKILLKNGVATNVTIPNGDITGQELWISFISNSTTNSINLLMNVILDDNEGTDSMFIHKAECLHFIWNNSLDKWTLLSAGNVRHNMLS